MVYALAVLYLVCVYVRPAEIIAGWEEFPFVEILSAISLLGVLGSLAVRPRRFWNQPQDWCLLGFLVAIVVSNAAWGWLFGAYQALLTMLPATFCYFLLRSAVESARQLRWLGYVLIAVTLFQAVNGIVQFRTGLGLGEVGALEMQAVATDDGDQDEDEVRRIRGTGIFNDPNDLALALVIVAPFLVGPMMRRATPMWARAIAMIVLVPIAVSLYYTNSRGGVLGLAAALLPYLYSRFGKAAGTVLTVAALAALIVFGPSRMNALDASESSAQSRVRSWAEGLMMFESHPLAGVGFGRYTEFNDLVAHNSFVHTLGELGLFGAFFFVGMGYWFFQSARQQVDVAGTETDTQTLRAWGDDLSRSGVGLAVCVMFLSQQYNMLLFIWLAMSACYLQVLRSGRPAVRIRPILHVTRISAITVAAVVCTYVLVRVFVEWGG
jgi:O-Antigen ligase